MIWGIGVRKNRAKLLNGFEPAYLQGLWKNDLIPIFWV